MSQHGPDRPDHRRGRHRYGGVVVLACLVLTVTVLALTMRHLLH